MRRLTSFAVITVLLLSITASGQTVDTVRFGNDYADYFGGGVFRVPIYYSNLNDSLGGLQIPLRFFSTGDIRLDSVTRAGRTIGTNIFDLFMGCQDTEGANPDSVCMGFVSIYHKLPPGSGVIADVWFSEGQIGDLLSFEEANGNAACVLENGTFPDGGEVVFETNHMAIGVSGLSITCGTYYNVEALQTISFPVTVGGGDAPYSLEIVSLIGPNMSYRPPTLSGSAPWTFTWSPDFYNTGEYVLTLRATDGAGEEATFQVLINVFEGYVEPTDVYRGDLNCDGVVDIADLVFMVDWMFTNGNPPSCDDK